jgi:hypothetical protein
MGKSVSLGRVMVKAAIMFIVVLGGLAIAGYPPSTRSVLLYAAASIVFGLGVEFFSVRQEQ